MQVIKYFVAFFVSFACVQAGAQIQQARGQHVLNYKEYLGVFDKKEAPPKAKQIAQQEAMLKAVEAYYAEAGQAESSSFDAIRSKVLENQGRYILDSTVSAEEDDKNDLKDTVVVRVSLNVANLRTTAVYFRSFLSSSSAITVE